MPLLETIYEQASRNKTGRIYVAIGACILITTVAHDAETAKSWGELFTPGSVFGIAGHAAGALLVYLGARQQDPTIKP